MAAATFRTKPFFGGAIEVQLPASFSDISDLRQVPSHQECWHDLESDEVLVVEIVEHQAQVPDQSAPSFDT